MMPLKAVVMPIDISNMFFVLTKKFAALPDTSLALPLHPLKMQTTRVNAYASVGKCPYLSAFPVKILVSKPLLSHSAGMSPVGKTKCYEH